MLSQIRTMLGDVKRIALDTTLSKADLASFDGIC